VQVHRQKFLFGENPGKICENLCKIPVNRVKMGFGFKKNRA